MRKGNATILTSIFVMLMVAAGVGAGTFAWLNDTETAQVTATAGTKNLMIAEGTRSGATGSWHSGTTLTIQGPTTWDDEDSFSFVIWFKNTGNAGALYLYREYGGFSGDDGFKTAVEIVSVYEYYSGAWDTTNWVRGSTDGSWSTWGWDWTGDHSDRNQCFDLGELLNMKYDKYDEKCYNYASVSGSPPLPTADYLPPGGSSYVAVEYTLKLMGSQTTNALQGQTFSFTITCHMTDENIHTYPGPVP